MTEVISVYAPVRMDPTDSYGLIGCELVRHLSRQNFHVNAIAPAEAINLDSDGELKDLIDKPIIPTRGGILLGYPTSYAMHGDLANMSPKIALTMFESTIIPEEWVPILNTCDAVIVPSHFCYQSFVDSGVVIPIFIFPLGVGEAYTYQERSLDGPFKFLASLDRGKRKGGLTVLEAFVDEFDQDPNVHLIFKSKKLPPGKPELEFEDPNKFTIYGDFTAAELNDLYGSCHCLINPNKGEGFGLIPREFAATGGIALATNWGGTADNIHLWGWPIDYTLEKADWLGIGGLQGRELGDWAKPDKFLLQQLMREVYENREYFQKEAIVKSEFTRGFYSWDFFARCVADIWRALYNGNRIGSKNLQAADRI